MPHFGSWLSNILSLKDYKAVVELKKHIFGELFHFSRLKFCVPGIFKLCLIEVDNSARKNELIIGHVSRNQYYKMFYLWDVLCN